MKTTLLNTAILKTNLFQLYLPLTLLTYLLITPASWPAGIAPLAKISLPRILTMEYLQFLPIQKIF